MLGRIAVASLKNRKGSVLLTVLSIVISVSLLLSVEFVRGQVRDSFTRTVSGVDLIVGARTGQLNLLLYSVFRIGNATNGIDWSSVANLQANPNVEWLIPIALGDTHEGFRVVGTNNDYFHHFKYGNQQPLVMTQGSEFTDGFSAVLGSEAAKSLRYALGDKLVIAHGLGAVSFHHHDKEPFTVSGILAPTGTPADKAVYVTLQGLEAAHHEPAQSSMLRKPVKHDGNGQDGEEHEHLDMNAPPEKVTAVLLGLKNRVTALQLQYQINQYKAEPLLAILPGVALSELWQLMGNVEKLLLGISVLILLSSLVGLITMLLASMRERKQEIAVLRVIGAGPGTLLLLVQAEAMLIAVASCALTVGVVSGAKGVFAGWLNTEYGLFLTGNLFTPSTAIVVGSVLVATWVSSFVPAIVAYRQALHAGLSQR